MYIKETHRVLLPAPDLEAEGHLPVRETFLLHDLLDGRQRRGDDVVHRQVDLGRDKQGAKIHRRTFRKTSAKPGLQALDGHVIQGCEQGRKVVGGEVVVVVARAVV